MFEKNILPVQRAFHESGYEKITRAVDISNILNADRVVDCEIIAGKDFFKIMYMEAEANWRSIARALANKSKHPCIIVTRYSDTHYIFTTVEDHGTRNARPRHVVIENKSQFSFQKFIQALKAEPQDDHVSLDAKVQNAFDKFSEYQQAIDKFGERLDSIIRKTDKLVSTAIINNQEYDSEAKRLLNMCKQVVSDKMDMNDVKSMLIQHILTYRIFAYVYDVTDFHTTNTVAKSLETLKNTLDIPYEKISYKTIELIAESIEDIDQRQEFLKKLYAVFYKKFDPERAKNEGIVYTPSPIVRFMVRSTNKLLEKHFQTNLSANNVTILDPAAGTGTFPVYLLHEIEPSSLEIKYEKELIANEISILPYYIAALNIEQTYKKLTGQYKEFQNICWIDTLDIENKDYSKLTAYFHEHDNIKRIARQRSMKINVVIGNPPYNAFLGARKLDPKKYIRLDEDIKKNYLTGSKKKQLKGYDMYKRFLRWSTNRLATKGIIAFVSNNSFLTDGPDDVFRKSLYRDFDYIYTVNLRGNTRNFAKLEDEGEPVFGSQAQVGIAISFFVKTGEKHSEIKYCEFKGKTREDKLKLLEENTVLSLDIQKITPSNNVWLEQSRSNFYKLIPIIDKNSDKSIFKVMTLGSGSNKNEWVYDFSRKSLRDKMKFYISEYNLAVNNDDRRKYIISLKNLIDRVKWSEVTIEGLKSKQNITYFDCNVRATLFRPFVTKFQYYDNIITHDMRSFLRIFLNGQPNHLILFQNPKERATFSTLASNTIVDNDCFDNTQNIPLWIYNEDGKRVSNVTSFGLNLFNRHYNTKKITESQLFYYVYAIFNDPRYVMEYNVDLKRDFPRVPFVRGLENFKEYSKLGETLFGLHTNYRNAAPYSLTRIENQSIKTPKPKLKIAKDKSRIIIDDQTELAGIPLHVYEYILNSKNPIEWILNQYSPKKNELSCKGSSDENVRVKFNTYNYSEYKKEMIDLLQRVITVCVDTYELKEKLKNIPWASHNNDG